MSILLFGKKAERTHENQMLRAFIQVLKADRQHTDKHLILIANSTWNNAEVDLVCILPSSILLVDFKDYTGHLTAKENGPWMIDGIEVKGGSKENPFQQLRDNKFSIMKWFSNNNLLQGRDISHTNAAVVFTGPVVGKPNLNGKITRWFHTADLDGCSALLADLASPKLRITLRDLNEIINALGVRKINDDYGQDNRGTAQLSKAPSVVATAPYESNIYLKKPNEATPAYTTAGALSVLPKAQRPRVVATQSARKRRLSRLFKSAAVVGGVFLTLAVVSQTYPMLGQSSTQLANELIQKVESMKTTVNSSMAQPKQAAVAPQKKAITPVKSYIETRSVSSYLGREITACGRVAQYVPFDKGAYLHFDKPYPQQTVTLVLWGHMLSSIERKLGRVNNLVGVDLCAHGYIERNDSNLHMQIADLTTVQLKSNNVSTAANKK